MSKEGSTVLERAKAAVPVTEAKVRLTVNGELHELWVKSRWTLQYAIGGNAEPVVSSWTGGRFFHV